jgi:hypothetical protein
MDIVSMETKEAAGVAFGHERDDKLRRDIWPYVGVALGATGLAFAIRAWRRRSPRREPVTVERSEGSTDSDEENRRSGPSV